MMLTGGGSAVPAVDSECDPPSTDGSKTSLEYGKRGMARGDRMPARRSRAHQYEQSEPV
jgi:hypothetical protein